VTDGLQVVVTRVVNACVLIELGGVAVLTDPYFERHWFMRMSEPIGLTPARLPVLAAVLGGHGVFDHWQPGSMHGYRHHARTAVFVPTQAMARKAKGFASVEVVGPGFTRQLGPGVRIEVVTCERVGGFDTATYVLEGHGLRVFVGTEARSLPLLRAWRARNPPVDVALLPIDGSSLFHQQLVMTPRDAVEGAQVLGARRLVPIHYALRTVWPLLRTTGTLAELQALAPGLIAVGQPGQRLVLTAAELRSSPG